MLLANVSLQQYTQHGESEWEGTAMISMISSPDKKCSNLTSDFPTVQWQRLYAACPLSVSRFPQIPTKVSPGIIFDCPASHIPSFKDKKNISQACLSIYEEAYSLFSPCSRKSASPWKQECPHVSSEPFRHLTL